MATVATIYFYITLHNLIWVNFGLKLDKMWYFFYYTSTDASALILQNKIGDKAPLQETFNFMITYSSNFVKIVFNSYHIEN